MNRRPTRRLAIVASLIALAGVAGCARTPELAYANTVSRFLNETTGAEYEALVKAGYGAAKLPDGTWTVLNPLSEPEKQSRLDNIDQLRRATDAAIAAAQTN